jgi:NTP pyrophosphatase (non-canonical NTP hydrolase)
MKWEALISFVEEWAYDRGILRHSTPQAQLLKAVSEMGELCDAEVKADIDEQEDAVGDVLVCLIIYCGMKGYCIHTCLETAYNEIKNRKGRMVEGGAFVKDE